MQGIIETDYVFVEGEPIPDTEAPEPEEPETSIYAEMIKTMEFMSGGGNG